MAKVICFDCENIVDKTHLMADGVTELCKECCYCNDD